MSLTVASGALIVLTVLAVYLVWVVVVPIQRERRAALKREARLNEQIAELDRHIAIARLEGNVHQILEFDVPELMKNLSISTYARDPERRDQVRRILNQVDALQKAPLAASAGDVSVPPVPPAPRNHPPITSQALEIVPVRLRHLRNEVRDYPSLLGAITTELTTTLDAYNPEPGPRSAAPDQMLDALAAAMTDLEAIDTGPGLATVIFPRPKDDHTVEALWQIGRASLTPYLIPVETHRSEAEAVRLAWKQIHQEARIPLDSLGSLQRDAAVSKQVWSDFARISSSRSYTSTGTR